MREIRFRAWDYTQNKIRIVTDLMSVCDGSWNVSYDGGENYTGDIVLMQYTGLKDKNGKEGYESDFFKDKHGIVYKVEHDENGWIFIGGDVGYRPSEFLTNVPYSLNGEFIGNVWENPELLEDKNAEKA